MYIYIWSQWYQIETCTFDKWALRIQLLSDESLSIRETSAGLLHALVAGGQGGDSWWLVLWLGGTDSSLVYGWIIYWLLDE